MTTPCSHQNLTVRGDTTYIGDASRWMLDLHVECADCSEPFRFLGSPIGVAFNRPTTDPAGTELRLPLEPESWQGLRLERPQGFERYALTTRATKEIDGIGHDRWNLSPSCEEAIDAARDLEILMFKAALPARYRLCPACQDLAAFSAGAADARPESGEELRLGAFSLRETVITTAAPAPTTPTAPETAPVAAQEPAVAAQTPAAPVVPLEPEEREEREGQPAAAQAATFLGLAPSADDEPPDGNAADVTTGVAIPRARGKRNR